MLELKKKNSDPFLVGHGFYCVSLTLYSNDGTCSCKANSCLDGRNHLGTRHCVLHLRDQRKTLFCTVSDHTT